MKYAILADVHANLEALTAVMGRVRAVGVDQIVCLGDIVGYYADPEACIEIIRDCGAACVAGNHDRVAAGLKEPEGFSETARRSILWTRDRLGADAVRYLRDLPLVRTLPPAGAARDAGGGAGQQGAGAGAVRPFLAVHAALHPRPNEDVRLESQAEARASFDVLASDFPGVNLCFFGHTHRPASYRRKGGAVDAAPTAAGVPLTLDADALYLVNPGSVGRPRDGDPRAAFLIYDAERRVVLRERVQYDRAARDRKAERAGLVRRSGILRRSARRIVNWVNAGAGGIGAGRGGG